VKLQIEQVDQAGIAKERLRNHPTPSYKTSLILLSAVQICAWALTAGNEAFNILHFSRLYEYFVDSMLSAGGEYPVAGAGTAESTDDSVRARKHRGFIFAMVRLYIIECGYHC